MTGKLGKYTWAVDAAGWTTVWVGPKKNNETLCDGFVIKEDPEEAILSVITSNEMFEKKRREKLNEFIVNQDPCPSGP